MRRASDFLYTKLYKLLKEQINTGMIKPGEFLMSEQELCNHYHMSRNSVRRALDELQKDNLVVKKPGLGTMVSPHLAARTGNKPVLRIAVPFPAYFVDYGLPTICEAFRRKYPAIDIHIIRLPSATYWESVRQAERMGSAPHVVLVSDGIFAEYSPAGNFVDLESSLGELKAVYGKIREAFRQEGKIIGAPITFTPLCLTYNPSLFEKHGVALPHEGWTANQFLDAAKQLTSVSNGIIDRFGFSLYPTLSRWLVFALQNGMRPGGINNRRIIAESLSDLQNWLHRERVATIYTDVWNMSNPYIYEKSAMSLTTLFEMSSWLDRGIGFTPQVASLPFGETKSTLMQANLLMIPEGNSEMELSLRFLETALESEVQQAFCDNTPFLSVKDEVNRAIRSSEYLRMINVGDGRVEHNYFVHELVDTAEQDESRIDLSLFWLGLEKAAHVANHF